VPGGPRVTSQRVTVLVGRIDAVLRSCEGQCVLAAEHPQGGLRLSGREGDVGALLDRLDQLAEALEVEVDAPLAIDASAFALACRVERRIDQAARPAATTVPIVPTAPSRSLK
jgi:hypothetical protein